MCWQPGNTIESLEKDAIIAAYKFYGNNKTKTAQSLDIAVRTLDYKLAKYEGREFIEEKTEPVAAVTEAKTASVCKKK